MLNWCNHGTLDGAQGDTGRWTIPQAEVHRLLDERRAAGRDRGRIARSEAANLSPAEAREWIERATALEREIGRLEGELRTRRELTEKTESTVRDELVRERERGERLDAQLRELRERGSGRGFWSRLFGGGAAKRRGNGRRRGG